MWHSESAQSSVHGDGWAEMAVANSANNVNSADRANCVNGGTGEQEPRVKWSDSHARTAGLAIKTKKQRSSDYNTNTNTTTQHNDISVSCLSSVCCRSAWRWPVWLKRWPGRQLRWPSDRWPSQLRRDSPSDSHWGVRTCWRRLNQSKNSYSESVCVSSLHYASLWSVVTLRVHCDQVASATRGGGGEWSGPQWSHRVRMHIWRPLRP